MENKISNEYIENAINELYKFFGVKEPVLGKNISFLIENGNLKEAVKLIARQLDLPIDINITIGTEFQSKHLTRIRQHGSQWTDGITAQVGIPYNLPLYGSSALNGYPINVKVSENCTKYPVTFSMIMAHELSHVLLYSLNHPEKDNEFYTDLLAMMLGFQNIFQKGRKIIIREETPHFMGSTITTTTITYGYLSDEQFNFAFDKINSILEKSRRIKETLSKKLKKFAKLLSQYEKTLFKFTRFLEYLTKNINKKISGKDGKRIVTFFQPGYIDELYLPLKVYKEKKERISKFLEEVSSYTEQSVNQLLAFTNDLKTYTNELKTKLVPLKKDVGMLKKYVSYKYRVKVFFLLLKMDKK